jgi:hypothetical protein
MKSYNPHKKIYRYDLIDQWDPAEDQIIYAHSFSNLIFLLNITRSKRKIGHSPPHYKLTNHYISHKDNHTTGGSSIMLYLEFSSKGASGAYIDKLRIESYRREEDLSYEIG